MPLRDVLAIAVFAFTILGVLIRPRGVSEAVVCVAGAVLAVLTRTVSPVDALGAIGAQWDVLLFFAGLLLVSWSSEQAGIFRWAALWTARLAHGSATRLFFNVCAAGIVLTTLLSNDATAILLTTLVVGITAELRLPVKPYAFACAFIANSASLTLPVSNPLNILVLGTGGAGLGAYLRHMLPASTAAIGLTVLTLWLCFRGDLDGRFDAGRVPAPGSAVRSPRHFRITLATLIALAASYVTASVLRWPLSLPVLAAGGLLLAATLLLGKVPIAAVRRAPWSIIPFVAGLLVVVRGLEGTGITRSLGEALIALERHGGLAGVLGATGISALGANLVNNLPMGAVMLSALHTAHAGAHPGLLYGTLLGSDVGPNLTVLGSLSSMLWLLLLRRRGVQVSAWEFARLGMLVTPPLLLVGALLIAATA